MIKRQILLLAISLLLALTGHGQDLKVRMMTMNTGDLSASIYERKDMTNQACALVKVQLAAYGAQFEGNVIGDVAYKTGEYWVYMSEGSKELRIKHPNFVPLHVYFPDYSINGVTAMQTYTLTLIIPQTIGMDMDDGMRYLAMTVEPTNATVYIDNSLQTLENGTLTLLLPMGQHEYRVEAQAYETKTGTFTIGYETLQLPIKLESAMASLSINSTTQGTQIYVNDQLRGTTSWNGTLPPGSYRVEGRLQGYRNHRQNITLAQHERQQLTIPALQAITGVFNVNYQPLNAEVWIDGKKVGTSPNVFRNISVGSHEVELRYAGYTSKKERITIEEGKTAKLTGSLSRIPSEDAEIEGKTAAQIRSIAYNYLEGKGGKSVDYAKAMKYSRIAAERGNADAMNDIGYMYDMGYGVEKDHAEANKWYRKAAEQGNAKAQYNLGQSYRLGQGIEKNYIEAVKWYRKAAEQGYAGGQVNLGNMYYMGYGVEKDHAEANKWYRKAAEQGNVTAQYNLGQSYRLGQGVNVDLTQAKYWYEKAAAQGDENAKKKLSELEELTISQKSVNQSSSDSKTGVETFTVNGVSFNMIRVEGGTFQMGATSEQGSDAERRDLREKPVHQVTLSSFYIGEMEVTQELWEAVMGSNPSTYKGAKCPVEMVSWNDCQEFIRKLKAKTGRQFRLPTEAEWEYAARGGKKSKGYKYSGSNEIDKVAWYNNISWVGTHDVGQKSPNELGLYDMSGNVYEWCQDWCGDYSSSSQTNPLGPLVPSSGSFRVFRGGGWGNSAWFCRVSNRDWISPDNSYNNLGLRLAL